MALIQCPEPKCNRRISDQADFCPNCGRAMSSAAGLARDGVSPGLPTVEPPPSPVASVPPAEVEGADRWDFLSAHGVLCLFDYFISDLDEILAAFMPRVRSGLVSGLHLHGEDWLDQQVRQLRRLLLPEAPDIWLLNSFDRHVEYAQRVLPRLTTLQVTFARRLTVVSMQELAALSSLTKVDLSLWQAHEGSANGIQELIRLPNLQSIQLPATLRNMPPSGGVARYEALTKFFKKAKPSVTVS